MTLEVTSFWLLLNMTTFRILSGPGQKLCTAPCSHKLHMSECRIDLNGSQAASWKPSLNGSLGGLGRRGQASDSAAPPPSPSIIYSFQKTWLDKYPKAFCQSTDLGNLKYIMTYVM